MREVIDAIASVEDSIIRQDELLGKLANRLLLLEKGQGYLARREVPQAQFYPRELVEAGYPAVEGLRVG